MAYKKTAGDHDIRQRSTKKRLDEMEENTRI